MKRIFPLISSCVFFFLSLLVSSCNHGRMEAAQHQISGQRLFHEGKCEEALVHLMKFKEYQAVAPDMDAYIGLSYLILGNIVEADSSFRRGIEDMEKTIFYTKFGYHGNRGGYGVVCAYNGNNGKAIKYLTDERRGHTSLHLGRLALIDIYNELGEHDKALKIANYSIWLIDAYAKVEEVIEISDYLSPGKRVLKNMIRDLVNVSKSNSDVFSSLLFAFYKEKNITLELIKAKPKPDYEKAATFYLVGKIYYTDDKDRNNIIGGRLAKVYYKKAIQLYPDGNFVWYADVQ